MLEIFAVVKTLVQHLGEDLVAWFPYPSGKFSIKSAFSVVNNDSSEDHSLFRKVWKVQAPQRLRSFLWLVSREALLTNQKRFHRGMTLSNSYDCCGTHQETVLHVLRDCFLERIVWTSTMPSACQNTFFTDPHQIWIEKNISTTSPSFEGAPWALLFSTTCHTLWRFRNQ